MTSPSTCGTYVTCVTYVTYVTGQRDVSLDLRPYLDPAAPMAQREAPLEHVVGMFGALRLRRLLVVDHHHQLVGIIGKKDLAPHVLRQRAPARRPAQKVSHELAEPASSCAARC